MTWKRGRNLDVSPTRVSDVNALHNVVLELHHEFEIIKAEEPEKLDSEIIELEEELYRLASTSFDVCEFGGINPNRFARGQFQTAYLHCVNYRSRISTTVLLLRGVS